MELSKSIFSEKKVVIATHNPGKLKEFEALFSFYDFTVIGGKSLGLSEPEETGTSFEENAYIKAYNAAKNLNIIALADDSGLSIEALGGEPGVYTADWCTNEKGLRDYDFCMKKIARALEEKGAHDIAQRRAQFTCVLCLAWPNGAAKYFRGEVFGTIVWPAQGEGGFDLDPIFKPIGYDKTFAQMHQEEKMKGAALKALSHRARAFDELRNFLDCLGRS